MSTFTLKLLLSKEIKHINKVIDQKIARGESYRKEAALHKRLLRKLNALTSRKSSSLALFL